LKKLLALLALLTVSVAFGQPPGNNQAGSGGVSVSGSVTSGHCVSWLSALQIQDAGAACGGSGGAFSGITAGTNANALVVGTGGSLGTSGTGTIAATSLSAASTAFTASGCANSTLVGGYTVLSPSLSIGAGSFTVGASGTCTITLTFGTAQHFWNCNGASDITSQILFVQTARSSTTCTISAAASLNDIVTFTAVGT